jgi:penicillin amidase
MSIPQENAGPPAQAATPPARRPGRARRWLKRLALTLLALVGLALLAVLIGGLWAWSQVKASLPEPGGERRVSGVAAPVTIARDALGIPTIQGASRRDVAFGTGFAHAQDRFFQMDLLRRRSAGELAEVFGPGVLPMDREMRTHRLRVLADRLWAASPPETRQILEAYAAGANAGLADLRKKPFEYLMMRADPRPWSPQDTFLVLFAMFSQLQEEDGFHETAYGHMRDSMPAELFQFLRAQGTEWDAPMEGEPIPAPPVPGPEVCDLRKTPPRASLVPAPFQEPPPVRGSNGWAIAGSHTADGGALLANDLHLDISVPNIWYRASLVWNDAAGPHRVTGVTLPGAPATVLGSNGKVAWGVTASVVDTADLIVLEVDPARPDFYQTPQGPRRFERHRETLRIKGGGEEALDVDWTIWGPVTGKDHLGRRRALRWVVHEPGAADFKVLGLETVQTLEEALSVAHVAGVPTLNFIAADAGGRVAWTYMGRIPRRVPGFDGEIPGSWADGSRGWVGLLPPEQVPQIVDPASGRLWNGNNRSVSGEALERIGGGAFGFGARARQIRDGLMALDRATAEDMLAVQLDDRALFLGRWRELMLSVLTPEAVAADPRRKEMREVVESWGGHAAVDSAGYRMVRSFRVFTARNLFQNLLGGCSKMPADFQYFFIAQQAEGPLWRLVSERPAHLLNPLYKTWDERLLAVIDEMIGTLPPGPLRDRTWGERNVMRIQHPISMAVPFLGRWLDMPNGPLPGDDDMPRVQHPNFGATLRMVVSPGREQQGYFHMPGGQSGHPLSPHYGDGYSAWAEGKPTPFLPGPPVQTLRLVPGG